jgi:hypothetical protein
MQVMGGLIGAIYVNPSSSVAASAAITALSALRRFVFVAHHFSITSINNSTDPFKVRTYTELSAISNISICATFEDDTVQDIYMINGQFQPKLRISTNEEVVLDLINASGDTTLEIDVREAVQGTSISSKCTLTHIAADGVYFTTKRSATYICLLPAMRATVIL